MSFEKLQDIQQIQDVRALVIREFGLPDERHNFRVSTENIPMSESQVDQAMNLTALMPGYIDGIGKLVQVCLINDKLRRSSPFFRSLRSILNLDSTFQKILDTQEKNDDERNLEAEQSALQTTISANHPFTRLDLIIDPQTSDLMIAEIEEAKLHGFGYATLCRFLSEDKIGSGLAERVAELSKDEPIGMLLSGFERFYEVEAKYFEKKVNVKGGNLLVIPENEMVLSDEGIVLRRFAKNIGIVNRLLTLPEFKQSKEQVANLNRAISRMYITGKIDVLSFCLPLLGEKATLALISNAQEDPELEALLCMCFDSNVLQVLRNHIPSTSLPLKKEDRKKIEDEILSGRQVFVKEISSSGARGIGKPGDVQRQIELLKSKKVIVQNAINPQYFELPFCDLRSGETGLDNFTTRIGVFGIAGKLADIAVTASPSAVAHGGVLSIQTGIKIVK